MGGRKRYSNECYSHFSMEAFTLDAYVLDALMPDLVGHDHRPSALIVFLYLWRKTGGGRKPLCASNQMIADGTGLSKRAVQAATVHLARRQLVALRRKRRPRRRYSRCAATGAPAGARTAVGAADVRLA
jgi:hypothetical protein